MKGIIIAGGEFPQGSSARRARIFRKALTHHGLETEILVGFPAMSEDDASFLEPGEHALLKPVTGSKGAEQKIQRSWITALRDKLLTGWRIRRFLLKHPVDFIITAPELINNLFLSGVCRRKKIRLLIERLDENRRKYLENKSLTDRIASCYESASDLILKKRFVTLYVISGYLEEKYKSLYPRIEVLRTPPSMIDLEDYTELASRPLSGVLPAFLTDELNTDRVKLCFSGSCVFTNGLNFALECLARAKAEGHGRFRYFMIFHKGFVSQIRETVARLGLEEEVRIIEGIYPQYLPAFYEACDIMILPEMGDVVANAGFPGKTSEYLASGKAILSTDFSNIGDFLKHEQNCLLSPLNDTETYTSNLVRLLTDRGLRNKLGAGARTTASESFDYRSAILPVVRELQSTTHPYSHEHFTPRH